jgi:hypothetical protein
VDVSRRARSISSLHTAHVRQCPAAVSAPGLARYSDWAFTSPVVVLVGALNLLAVELAYSRGRRIEPRELVGATVGVLAEEPWRPSDERVTPDPLSRRPTQMPRGGMSPPEPTR